VVRRYISARIIPFGVVLALAIGAPLAAQTPRDATQEPHDVNGITPAEVQRMFDAYALVQAQDALSLPEAQYARFVTRFKALQDARRRHVQARAKILGELRRAMNNGQHPAEAFLSEQVKAFRDEDDRAAGDVRQALDSVDEVLDAPQQARFRLYEERMETRKLELLIRARQNARKARGGSSLPLQ